MTHAAIKLALVCVLAAGLVACREDEQNRPLSQTPGQYTGTKDEKLSDADRDRLRDRARLQNF